MAEVIDSAFSRNLQAVLPDREKRLRVLATGTNLAETIGAYLGQQLVGVIGFSTGSVSVYDGMTFALLRREAGSGAMKIKLALKILNRPLEAGTMRIDFVAVAPAAQGRGAGRVLLSAVERNACARGARLLELHVEATNVDAQRLYLREGFCETDPGTDPVLLRWLRGQPDIRMTKEPQCTTS